MWIRELATGWGRVYKPSEHASASVTRGTRDAVPTETKLPLSREQESRSPEILREPDYLESILNNIILVLAARYLYTSTHRNQLYLYLQEPTNKDILLIDYLKNIKD
jgi:hypothetical protein